MSQGRGRRIPRRPIGKGASLRSGCATWSVRNGRTCTTHATKSPAHGGIPVDRDVPDRDALAPFKALLGAGGVLTAPSMTARYTRDQRDLMQGETPAVLRPRIVDEVQALVRLARTHGFGLVPQGGNTGYVGGATPEPGRRQLVVSLERMTRIRAVDPLNFTLACDAGTILADAQAAAEADGLFLPLSLGSEGSCRLGGNLGTNAGGLQVLRYGMARDLVLGLEVVLPDGTLFSDMRTLRKNNIGYDLKQLFIGAEGTLGIITGVVLKLWPAQGQRATAWLQLAADAPIPEIAALVRRETSDLASTFELISASSLGLVTEMRGAETGLTGRARRRRAARAHRLLGPHPPRRRADGLPGTADGTGLGHRRGAGPVRDASAGPSGRCARRFPRARSMPADRSSTISPCRSPA